VFVFKRPVFKTVGNVRKTQHGGALTEPFLQWTTENIPYSECISALDNRHAKRKHHITLSTVNCLVLQFASTLSHKWHDFKKTFWKIKCVFWFFLPHWSGIFLILRRIQRNIIVNVRTSLWKIPVILFRLWRNLNFF
jgi:hypothetical protein